MLSNSLDSSDGDNKNFAVDGVKTITIYIDHTNTSANDTDTEKYFDNTLTAGGAAQDEAKAIFIRSNQTFQILSMNDTTFTDPIDVVIGDGTAVPASAKHREVFDKAWLRKLVIKTTVATGTTTNIKIRVK